MKITRIETIPIRVPLKPEFAIRSGRGGAHTVSPFLIVLVHTDAGLIGLGEASCTPRWSGEDQTTAAHLLKTYLEPIIVGQDPLEIAALTRSFRLAFAGNYFAKAAVEMALWDIAGKAQNKPVFELLGGQVRDCVPTKWSVSGVAPEKAAAIASWAISQGFGALKVKVGIDAESDVARVEAVREAIGPRRKLGVDANGGWDFKAAVSILERLAPQHLAFAEQPLPPEEIASMLELRQTLKMPVIADESLYTLQDARVLAKLEAADVLSLYVGKCGGLGPAREIAAFAAAAGLSCTVGSNLELGVGSAAMIHLALATPAIQAAAFPCDIIGPFYYEEDILTEPLSLQGGFARASRRPGLGVELDPDKVHKYRVPA